MPIRTGTRLDALEALLRHTDQEIACARRRDADTGDLATLRQHVVDEIAAELTRGGMTGFARPGSPNKVDRRLAELGVTAYDVKVWAFDQGLVDAVKRGRVGQHLVEAYATATAERRALQDEYGVGICPACDDQMVRPDVWHRATPAERTQWKHWGFARQGGRGFCTKCYVRLKNHGELDRYVAIRRLPGAGFCCRCGLTDIQTNEDRLCPDCAEFVATDQLGATA